MSIDLGNSKRTELQVLRGIQDAMRASDALYGRLSRLERIIKGAGIKVPRRPPVNQRSPVIPVLSVATAFQFDGSGITVIDGSEPIVLSPDLAALLAILAEDSRSSDDSLVGWKSYKDVRLRLYQKRNKKSPTKRALLQAVYRLRNLLEDHGFSRALVQYHPRLGYRLAVRRKAPASLQPNTAASPITPVESGGDYT